MDLKKLDSATLSQAGVEYQVRHPASGEVLLDEHQKPMTLKLLGPDSKEYRRLMQAQMNSTLRQQFDARSRKMALADNKLTAQALEEHEIQLCVNCTIGWDNVTENDVPLEFTKENAERVYRSFPFVREQVSFFINDRVNFLQDSKKN